MFHYDVTQKKSQSARKLPRHPGLCLLEQNILDKKGAYLYSGLRILS